jgi:hypothetical protein
MNAIVRDRSSQATQDQAFISDLAARRFLVDLREDLPKD